jgi:hypothetical protein
MITDVKDIENVKVGHYVVNIYEQEDEYIHIKFDKISSIDTDYGTTTFKFEGGKTAIHDLFQYDSQQDYVCETYQEVLDNFSEYML